mmetsp:Transcript_102264/g.161543  ORF Transcript_102264/g.161543 Transcript_102264/m.161543 type:complete len:245 (-) Transcript_102264:329-1063(-)
MTISSVATAETFGRLGSCSSTTCVANSSSNPFFEHEPASTLSPCFSKRPSSSVALTISLLALTLKRDCLVSASTFFRLSRCFSSPAAFFASSSSNSSFKSGEYSSGVFPRAILGLRLASSDLRSTFSCCLVNCSSLTSSPAVFLATSAFKRVSSDSAFSSALAFFGTEDFKTISSALAFNPSCCFRDCSSSIFSTSFLLASTCKRACSVSPCLCNCSSPVIFPAPSSCNAAFKPDSPASASNST